MPDLILCLDPGTTTGTALLEMGASQHPGTAPAAVHQLAAYAFEHVYAALRGEESPAQFPPVVAVVIEDTRHQPIHAKRSTGKNSRQLASIARDVGRVDLMVDLLESAARRMSHPQGALREDGTQGGHLRPMPVVLVEPTGAKWDSRLFRRITGYDGPTRGDNQHTRDAVRAGWTVTRSRIQSCNA